jgi:hypothetical protein
LLPSSAVLRLGRQRLMRCRVGLGRVSRPLAVRHRECLAGTRAAHSVSTYDRGMVQKTLERSILLVPGAISTRSGSERPVLVGFVPDSIKNRHSGWPTPPSRCLCSPGAQERDKRAGWDALACRPEQDRRSRTPAAKAAGLVPPRRRPPRVSRLLAPEFRRPALRSPATNALSRRPRSRQSAVRGPGCSAYASLSLIRPMKSA